MSQNWSIDGTADGTVTFTATLGVGCPGGTWVLTGTSTPGQTNVRQPATGSWTYTLGALSNGKRPITATMSPVFVGPDGAQYSSMTGEVQTMATTCAITVGNGTLKVAIGTDATWAASDTSVGDQHGHEKVKE